MRADIVPGGIFPDYELTDHAFARSTRGARLSREGGPVGTG